ncbi:MAG: succinyl-CoA synthetase beta subunit [Actinomycetota bacterium]|nr:succinyl-CoA synthetase beta subunit [Actinomycetota bacterium]
MDLFEYQARDLFAAHGVPVLPAQVASDPDGAVRAAQHLGGGTVVVKAQVKTGGRGKAGGIRLAHDPQQAGSAAAGILGMDIKGHTVHRVMVARGASIAQEYYAAILLDRTTGGYLALVSREGGVEIEQLAVERPQALVRVPLDPVRGLDAQVARELVDRAGFTEHPEQIALVLTRLWELFVAQDATLVEVNPLVLTVQGEVIALDGKVTLDDNARFRHPEHAALAESWTQDPWERRAHELGLNYVRLEGQVGVIGNGAGLVMSTLDVVARAGEEFCGVRPANFLDIGGGASAQVMADGLRIVLADPQVRSVFVNVFGGITACDVVARGIVQAFEALRDSGEPVSLPLVVRLDGNNAAAGQEILRSAGLPGVELVRTMDGAAGRAAELAADRVGKD